MRVEGNRSSVQLNPTSDDARRGPWVAPVVWGTSHTPGPPTVRMPRLAQCHFCFVKHKAEIT